MLPTIHLLFHGEASSAIEHSSLMLCKQTLLCPSSRCRCRSASLTPNLMNCGRPIGVPVTVVAVQNSGLEKEAAVRTENMQEQFPQVYQMNSASASSRKLFSCFLVAHGADLEDCRQKGRRLMSRCWKVWRDLNATCGLVGTGS